MRRAARLLFNLIVLLAAAAVPCLAETVARLQKPTAYVDDYAGVFANDETAQMEALCREVHDKTRAQVFVVTIRTLEGGSIDQFANELFHKWKIGEKKTDRGVLLLFAVAEHKRRIEVGYGLEGALNDAKAGDIGRDMVPGLRAGHYGEAAALGLREVSGIIAQDAGVTLDVAQQSAANESTQTVEPEASVQSSHGMQWIAPVTMLGVWFLIVMMVVVRAAMRGARARGIGPAGFYDGGTTFGGGDSFSGGGSSFSSGDGSSFGGGDSGGGSDSFSGGDGGDSGGGGASGDW